MAWNGVHDRAAGGMAAGDELTVAAYAGRFLPRSDAGAEREDLHVEAEADHPAAVEQPECPGAVSGAGDVGWGGVAVSGGGSGGRGPGGGGRGPGRGATRAPDLRRSGTAGAGSVRAGRLRVDPR